MFEGEITMNTKLLRENLIKLRDEKGLTQKQLAEELNYSDKVISKWERGESIPNIEVLSDIADFYSTSIDELVGRKKQFDFYETETIKLDTIRSESPSFLELLFIVPFAIFAGASLISWNHLIGPALILFGISLSVYSLILAKASFITDHKEDHIVVMNRAFRVIIKINGEIVLNDKHTLKVNPLRVVRYMERTYKFQFKNMTTIKCNIYVIDKKNC
jgi:transcriptional regulator with XRE-family HTH domain